MPRTVLQEAGDRLGWIVYLTVMGGGVSYWPLLFVERREEHWDREQTDDGAEPAAIGEEPAAEAVPRTPLLERKEVAAR